VRFDEINVIIHSAVAVALLYVALRNFLPKLYLVFLSFRSSLLLLVAVHLFLHLSLSNKCLFGNRYEGFFDILVFASRSLNKAYVSILGAPLFCCFSAHTPRFFLEVDFVSY